MLVVALRLWYVRHIPIRKGSPEAEAEARRSMLTRKQSPAAEMTSREQLRLLGGPLSAGGTDSRVDLHQEARLKGQRNDLGRRRSLHV